MSISEQKRKQTARKAVRTRKERERKRKNIARAHKAVKTITKSEKGYIPKLARFLGISQKNIFHHIGLPDLIVIGNRGTLEFYEIKPKKGDRKKRLLNRYQKETVKRLLNLELKNIYVVRYEKRGNKYYYEEPIRLSTENLDEHCL